MACRYVSNLFESDMATKTDDVGSARSRQRLPLQFTCNLTINGITMPDYDAASVHSVQKPEGHSSGVSR